MYGSYCRIRRPWEESPFVVWRPDGLRGRCATRWCASPGARQDQDLETLSGSEIPTLLFLNICFIKGVYGLSVHLELDRRESLTRLVCGHRKARRHRSHPQSTICSDCTRACTYTLINPTAILWRILHAP